MSIQERIARAKQLLEKHNWDAIIATTAANFFYFSQTWIEPRERFLCFLVKKNGDPVVFAPEMHVEDLHQLSIEKVFWQDGQNAVSLLAKHLPDSGTISVDNFWQSHFLLTLMNEKPHLKFVDSKRSIDVLRRVKDAYEIQQIREAGAQADRVMAEIIKKVAPGVTEIELLEELKLLWKQEGVHQLSFTPIIGAGKNGALPHYITGNVPLQEGDMLIIDTGGVHNYYRSDMTRTVAVSSATSKMKEVHALVAQAYEAGVASIRPGVTLGEVDAATRHVIEQAGYGSHFVHRTGHGLGIEGHEEPYVYTGNSIIAEPGMVFSVEPGIYLPGEFGVRIEDVVAVTENGYESFNRFTKEMLIL